MASISVKMTDETTSGKIVNEVEVLFAGELTTVKEIITARVSAEVANYNNQMPAYYKGLIQPTEAETTLNGYRLQQKRKVAVEQQVETALDAFGKNGYFILIDNIQAESLEQMVVITPQTTISFIKLTPLVGG
jgi:hypothetical protein